MEMVLLTRYCEDKDIDEKISLSIAQPSLFLFICCGVAMFKIWLKSVEFKGIKDPLKD